MPLPGEQVPAIDVAIIVEVADAADGEQRVAGEVAGGEILERVIFAIGRGGEG